MTLSLYFLSIYSTTSLYINIYRYSIKIVHKNFCKELTMVLVQLHPAYLFFYFPIFFN